jgi:hypothetical protein
MICQVSIDSNIASCEFLSELGKGYICEPVARRAEEPVGNVILCPVNIALEY